MHGVDICDNHNGKLIFDSCASSIPAANEDYLIWLSNYANQHKISFVIPTSEAEISKLSEEGTELSESFKILINNADLVTTCLDKFQTMTFLQRQGVPTPNFGLVSTEHPTLFPIIVKPRRGRGSGGLKVLCSEKELLDYDDSYLWQELLMPHTEEYTCAIYKSPRVKTRTLIMRRTLRGGLTISGEVVQDEHHHYVHQIAEALS